MPCLQKVLAGVILLSSAAYGLAPPDEAEAGKIRGFTGPAGVNPTGDFLTATFCYCEYPQYETKDVMGPAHYYQFEYYNKHHDTTFVLTSACPDGDINFDISCAPESDGPHVLAEDTMEQTCKLWQGWETVHATDMRIERRDELCYMPHHKHGNDYIFFNGQKRNLGKSGHQGAVFKQDHETEEICIGMCREYMDMGISQDSAFIPSHQVTWTHLDDMCSHCE